MMTAATIIYLSIGAALALSFLALDRDVFVDCIKRDRRPLSIVASIVLLTAMVSALWPIIIAVIFVSAFLEVMERA